MKTVRTLIQQRSKQIALLLILSAVALGLYVVWRIDSAPRTDDAYVYADTIGITPEVNGRIVELAVKEGQAVKAGDVLLRIDARVYQQTVAKAQAALVELDQQIALTQRSVNTQKTGAQVAAVGVERVRAALKQAVDTRQRMEPLLAQGYISAEQVDQARTAQRLAETQLAAAELETRRALEGVSGVDALVARRQVVQAEIELARIGLANTEVRAPFDGRVIGLTTAAGQFAAAGHPLFTLADTRHWYVVANFRETELERIRPGTHAQVYLLGHAGKAFNGAVQSVGYGVFPDDGGAQVAGLPRVPRSINWVRVAQRFPVRILVENPDPALFRIGGSAIAQLTLAPHAD